MQHRVVSEYVQNSDSTNVKVYVRARPVDDQHESDFIQIGGDGRQISIKDPVASSRKHTEVSFQFDNIFWTDASQESVFENMVKNQVDHILNGFNCCCCACELFSRFSKNIDQYSLFQMGKLVPGKRIVCLVKAVTCGD